MSCIPCCVQNPEAQSEQILTRCANSAATKFTPILSISDKNKKAIALQKWANEFFKMSATHHIHWRELLEKTGSTFIDRSKAAFLEKLKSFNNRIEKDPDKAEKIADEISRKIENNIPRSEIEREYEEEMMAAADALFCPPDFKDEQTILTKSILAGSLLRASGISLFSDTARTRFKTLLKSQGNPPEDLVALKEDN